MSNRLPILAVEVRRAHSDVGEAEKAAAESAIEGPCCMDRRVAVFPTFSLTRAMVDALQIQ